MKIGSIFEKNNGKFFGNDIEARCEYCQFGKRAKDGMNVLCEKVGVTPVDSKCSKYIYSPLKRIPKKQLNRVDNYDEEEETVSEDEE
jgi:hypothetical protein